MRIFELEGVFKLGGQRKKEWLVRKNDLNDWLVKNKNTGEFFVVIGKETTNALCNKLNLGDISNAK